MRTIILVPIGTKALVNEVFSRTKDYMKTYTIMLRDYNIKISSKVIKSTTLDVT